MTLFDGVAAEYDSARPDYPETLYALLPALDGAVVIDVGAGTGISTRGLIARGAQVVALDVGPGMLRRLRARTAGAFAVQGDGNDLPARDRSVHLVTYAQSWHWLDSERSMAEARRVLRPGGGAAAWWNLPDRLAAEWLEAQRTRLAETCPGYYDYRERFRTHCPSLDRDGPAPVAAIMIRLGFEVRETFLSWTRRVPLEKFLTDLRSHSYLAALPRSDADAVLERERQELTAVFPDGDVIQPIRLYVGVGRL